MFYDISNFPYLQPFVENICIIADEFATAQANLKVLQAFMTSPESPEFTSHVDYWTKETGIDDQTIGYDSRLGVWGSFPIHKQGFPVKWYDAPNTFPYTWALLKQVPDMFYASFFRLGPNSKIATHQHKLPHLIFHVSLFDVNGYCSLTCQGEEHSFEKQGQYAIFDYRLPHSSLNNSQDNRINLTIDFSYRGIFEDLKRLSL